MQINGAVAHPSKMLDLWIIENKLGVLFLFLAPEGSSNPAGLYVNLFPNHVGANLTLTQPNLITRLIHWSSSPPSPSPFWLIIVTLTKTKHLISKQFNFLTIQGFRTRFRHRFASWRSSRLWPRRGMGYGRRLGNGGRVWWLRTWFGGKGRILQQWNKYNWKCYQ